MPANAEHRSNRSFLCDYFCVRFGGLTEASTQTIPRGHGQYSCCVVSNRTKALRNRIGGNINQIARAANTSVLHGKAVEFDLSEIRETKAVIEIALAQLNGALDNNADYWETRR
jgi:hypothetical protein